MISTTVIGNKNRVLFIVVAIVVVASIAGAIFYLYTKNTDASLTNAEETVLQQEIARIIASKKVADCATISNTIYRKACEQALSAKPQGNGSQLQTTSAEPMTTAQLQMLLKNTPSQPYPAVRIATTTP